MRTTFKGFYSIPDELLREIWNADATLFVFDTNCLLNLYRCEDHTREEILDVMRELSSRTWLPFQIGYEYQKNRRKVIEDSIQNLEGVQVALKKIYQQDIIPQAGIKKHLNTTLNSEVLELKESLQAQIDEYISAKLAPRIESKNNISKHDFIRDSIDEIIGDKIGASPTKDKIDAINAEGEVRYSNKIPPGFHDDKKSESNFFSGVELKSKFGDLYLWKQIIEKASSPDISNVIFVCDDNKEDWWYVCAGKKHGPLEALKTEICSQAAVENFKMMNQSAFLQYSKQYLGNVTVSDSSLEEVDKLSNDISGAYHSELAKNKEELIYNSIITNHIYKNALDHKKEELIFPTTTAPNSYETLSDFINQIQNDFNFMERRSRANYDRLRSLDNHDIDDDEFRESINLKDELVDRMLQAKTFYDQLTHFKDEYKFNGTLNFGSVKKYASLLERQILIIEKINLKIESLDK